MVYVPVRSIISLLNLGIISPYRRINHTLSLTSTIWLFVLSEMLKNCAHLDHTAPTWTLRCIFLTGPMIVFGLMTRHMTLHRCWWNLTPKVPDCIQVILYILYCKVYNSSYNQVGHDLIDRVQIFARANKYYSCYLSANFMWRWKCFMLSHRCIDAVNMVYQIMPYIIAVWFVYLLI